MHEKPVDESQSPESSDLRSDPRPQPPSGSGSGGGPSRPVVLSALGLIVVLAALGLAFLSWDGGDQDAPPAAPPQAAAPAPAPAEPAKPAAPEVDPNVPAFDVVRIDPQGNTVIAGRAVPDSTVVILDDGREVGRVTADARGEWVFLPDEPLPPGNRELTLRAIAPDGTEATSEEVVILVVPEDPGARTLALQAGRDGAPSRLLQGAAPLAEQGALALDVVDYDDDGKLVVSGRAAAGATVQLYLDNEFLGRATAGREDGAWSLSPDTPASVGPHTLRADMLGPDGAVQARVEVPFERTAPEVPEGVRVVVQPGNNLWLLARRAYGAGTSFTVIYDANKGHIRNPDLIYPGQVFILPSAPPAR